MAAIKDGHPNGENQERKADADESYRSNSQRQFTWPPSPGTCMSAMCRRSEHHNSGSGCRCGILSPRRTALHCSRICCGQFFAEGIIDAQLSVIPKRFSGRQERAAHRLRHQVLREYDHVVPLVRDDRPVTSGAALRSGLGQESVRQWPAAESAYRGQRSYFSFLVCTSGLRPPIKRESRNRKTQCEGSELQTKSSPEIL
jgi:hypothetical protein